MEKKKKSAKKIIIFSMVCVIVVGFAGYFLFGNIIKKSFPFDASDRGGNFQSNQLSISDVEKTEITSFFENSPSLTEVQDYCQQNKNYCFYYCFELKGSNEYCIEMMNNKPTNNTQMPPRGEMPQ